MGKLPPLLGKDVVDRIFEAIENAGIKINRAAIEMKMPASTVYSWRSREKTPGRASIRKVADLTGYTVADIEGADPVTVDETDPAPLQDFLETPVGKRAAANPRALDYLRGPHFRRLGMTAEGYQDLFRAFEASDAGRLLDAARIEGMRKSTAMEQDAEVAKGRVMLTAGKTRKAPSRGR